MGGSVTILILLILDLVVCAPRMSHNHPIKSIEKHISKRHKIRTDDAENIGGIDERPLNENIDSASDKPEDAEYNGGADERPLNEDVDSASDKPEDAEYTGGVDERPLNENIDSASDKPEDAKNTGGVYERPLNEENESTRDESAYDDFNPSDTPDIYEACHDANGCEERLPGRSLRAGDTFTPQEMLPIAKQLMKKVDNPGEGKGIVSSAIHPQALSDTLFEAYFMTMNRIITLKPNDIPGLDALQALSLSGTHVKMIGVESDSITESPNNKNGENIPSDEPEKCKYKVVTKQEDYYDDDDDDNEGFNVAKGDVAHDSDQIKHEKLKFGPPGVKVASKSGKRRFSIRELADKTLAKKRKLVIKSRRRRKKESLKKEKRVLRSKKRTNKKMRKGKRKTMSTDSKNTKGVSKLNDCRWRYECTDPADQRTCHVSPDCISNRTDKYFGDKNVKNPETLKKFRRMIGIETIDEEVEKILERHTLSVKSREQDALKIESIGEYFNELLKREENKAAGSTTAIPK